MNKDVRAFLQKKLGAKTEDILGKLNAMLQKGVQAGDIQKMMAQELEAYMEATVDAMLQRPFVEIE